MDLFAASEERGEATILVTFDQKISKKSWHKYSMNALAKHPKQPNS